MLLTNFTDFPPAGYLYYEAALKWRCPQDIATQGLGQVAAALRQVRLQNPQSGLDPSIEACKRDIGIYTCARLAQWPDQQRYYCGGGEQTDQERQASAAAQVRASAPRGCASCGGRRR